MNPPPSPPAPATSGPPANPAPANPSVVSGQQATPRSKRRRRRAARPGRALLVVGSAVLVLRTVEAGLALLTAAALAVLPLSQPSPRLTIAGLAGVGLDPQTATTALVSAAVAAIAAAVLLHSRSTVAGFAGIKAFAVLVADAATGVFAAGPLDVRVAVGAVGLGVAVAAWPSVRAAVPRVLAVVGFGHVHGRAADGLLVLKIGVLVALVVLSQ